MLTLIISILSIFVNLKCRFKDVQVHETARKMIKLRGFFNTTHEERKYILLQTRCPNTN